MPAATYQYQCVMTYCNIINPKAASTLINLAPTVLYKVRNETCAFLVSSRGFVSVTENHPT